MCHVFLCFLVGSGQYGLILTLAVCYTCYMSQIWAWCMLPWCRNLYKNNQVVLSSSSRENKIWISSVYQALYIVSQPWQTGGMCDTYAVQKDIIISDVIIIIAIHLSGSLCLQHVGMGAGKHCSSSSGTVTARRLCTSCTQAQLKHQLHWLPHYWQWWHVRPMIWFHPAS